MADAADWFLEFRALHERAKKDELSGDLLKTYFGAREQFARALVTAQGLTVPEGQLARNHFRVAQAFQIELKPREAINSVRAVTLDIGMNGFACVIAQPPPIGETLDFALKLPGKDPINGSARVVSAKKQPGNFRMSFAFEKVPEAELNWLEMVLFDSVLARMPK